MYVENTLRPWAEIHPDFKSVINGKRFALELDDKTGATVLAPWVGPEKADS